MEKVIQIRDAIVKTLKVEIKSLTIGPKQMTLAVFRQLINEPLINIETGELKGIPWGTVHYYPGKCFASDGENLQEFHIHVVWQKGDQLRRACECAPIDHTRDYTNALNVEILARAWHAVPKIVDNRIVWDYGRSIHRSWGKDDVLECIDAYSEIGRYAFPSYWAEDVRARERANRRAKISALYRSYGRKMFASTWPPVGSDLEEETLGEILGTCAEVYARDNKRLELHQKNFAALETMDQLFIAV